MTRRVLEVGAACLLGVVVALVGFRFLTSDDGAGFPGFSTSTLPVREPVDPSGFLDAWERSLTSEHVITGTLERTNGGISDPVVVTVRRARKGDRSLDQTGSTALVVRDGQQRTCEIATNGDVGCGPPSSAKRAGTEREELGRAVDQDYLVYDDSPGCFLLAAATPAGLGHRFGQESLFCFDSETGAMMSSREWTGNRRAVFLADSTSGTVTESDLTPG